MPRWIPGRSRGRPYNIQFTLAVNFKLVSKIFPNGNPNRLKHSELEKDWSWVYITGSRIF